MSNINGKIRDTVRVFDDLGEEVEGGVEVESDEHVGIFLEIRGLSGNLHIQYCLLLVLVQRFQEQYDVLF